MKPLRVPITDSQLLSAAINRDLLRELSNRSTPAYKHVANLKELIARGNTGKLFFEDISEARKIILKLAFHPNHEVRRLAKDLVKKIIADKILAGMVNSSSLIARETLLKMKYHGEFRDQQEALDVLDVLASKLADASHVITVSQIRDLVQLRQLIKENKIDNPEFERNLKHYLHLAPEMLSIAKEIPAFLNIAHTFLKPEDLDAFRELMTKTVDELLDLVKGFHKPNDLIKYWIIIDHKVDIGDPQNINQIVWPLNWRPGQRVILGFPASSPDNNAFAKLSARVMKLPGVPAAIKQRAETVIAKSSGNRFGHIFSGVEPERIPEKIRGIAREMAEIAHKTLTKVREVALANKRPTLDIYILSTAHGFNGERILDCFYKDPVKRKNMIERISRAGGRYPGLIAKANGITDSASKVEEEMRIIHHAFFVYVEILQRVEKLDRLSAIMRVGHTWMTKGYLDYFTYPFEIKIPSGSPASPENQQRLQNIAKLAEKMGWNMTLIDHSTVRDPNVVHRNDPPEFEKGRAIARAIDIIRNALSNINVFWLFKNNKWILDPSFQQKISGVNVIGLNLYDGKTYDKHVWGRKEEWAKIDDHGKTILGVEAERNGGKMVQTNIVLDELADGTKVASSSADVYWTEFRRILAELENWPPTAPSFRYSNIVFVCNANHHRSTSFEALVQNMLRTRIGADAEKISISSAGLDVSGYLKRHPEKEPMSSRAKEMLEKQGIEFLERPKIQLTEEIVNNADLLLVMTERERDLATREFKAWGKVQTIKEFLDFPKDDQNIPTPAHFTPETFFKFQKLAEGICEKIVK